MAFFPASYTTIVSILIYIAIAMHIISAPDNEERLKILLIVTGFFVLTFLLPNDFFLLQTIIVAWLILTGAEMIVSRKVMLGMLAIVVLTSNFIPWFFFINFLFYVIVVGGFIFSAFRKISEKAKSTQ